MQEQQYESIASEPERDFVKQGARDRWSEGEKLQVEPKHMGGLSPYTTIILVMVVLFVLLVIFFLLAGIAAHVHVSHGLFQRAVPGPIQQP